MTTTRLAFQNFEQPFITHGIDVIQDPADANAVYIFAVNHQSNPEYYEREQPDTDATKARSQIELFHHALNSTTVTHIRSIRHPLITTPNDIYADSPSSFYVTNDHFYREGIARLFEDIVSAAKWSNIIHVQVDELRSADPESGLRATVALDKIHNANGLGHGSPDGEIVITSAMSATLFRARADETNHSISILETIPVASQIDNPSYFSDPYRTPSDDASGYLSAGLLRAIDIPRTHTERSAKDGVLVWYLRSKSNLASVVEGPGGWEQHVLFEDDGTNIRSASAAVLVPINPKVEQGKKKAWLFVTGFFSESMIAVKVDL